MNANDKIFCAEWLVDRNGTRAYMKAHPGCTDATARVMACRLLANPNIRAYLDEQIQLQIDGAGISAIDIARKLWMTANADPNELIEIRRDCCRHCYGENNRYQFTMGEWDSVTIRHQQDVFAAEMKGKAPPPEPDPRGGLGFNRRMPPNPACPECFGEGIEDHFVKDTRYLSPAARELYAGVKITKNGLEIQKHSRDKALELLGRHQAMFTDNVDHKNNGGSFEPMTLSDFYAALPPKK